MFVLLPDRRDGLRDLEGRLSASMLERCANKTLSHEVDLFVPRFKMTWGTVDLREPLVAMGLTKAFDQFRADFSGINGLAPPEQEAISISSAFHKTFIEVNEEGTEAAGGAAIAMETTSAWHGRPAIALFRADHPFLFAIRDRESGAFLFLGRVADPTRGS